MSVFFDIKSEFANYILEHDFLGLLLLDRMGFIRLANEKTGMIQPSQGGFYLPLIKIRVYCRLILI
jgi:hypothetical protein